MFKVSLFLLHKFHACFLVRDDVMSEIEVLEAKADAEWSQVIHEKLELKHRLWFDVVERYCIVTNCINSLKNSREHYVM